MTTAVQVQYRRGSSTQVAGFTGAQGEMVVDTTTNRLVVQDGATAGGWPSSKLAETVTSVASSGGGTVTTAASPSGIAVTIGEPGGFLNKFRNGIMDVWQRGTCPSLAAGTSGSQYTADGWMVTWSASAAAAPAVSQAGGRLITKNSLAIAGAAAITDLGLAQRIESSIAAALCSQTVTVQAQIYNNTGGSITPTLTVKRPSTQDGWSGTVNTDVNAVSLQSCPANSWTLVAYTFPGNAACYNGLQIGFDFGNNFAANSKTLQITECDIRVTPGVSAGVNSNPPPPELRPIAAELALCQRYYWRLTPTTAGAYLGIAQADSSTDAFGLFFALPVNMRAAPTCNISSPSDLRAFSSAGASETVSAISLVARATNQITATSITTSGLTAGNAVCIQFNDTTGWIDASSEL